jgi:hypothetical protein
MTKNFKSFIRTDLSPQANKIKNRGPGSQQAALSAHLQQNDVCFTKKSRTKQNPNPNESDSGII